jgi:uncharacterized repeat protein (TIGR03803 family)
MKLAFLCAIAAITAPLSGSFAFAQTYKVLWSFGGNDDGGYPLGSLIFDSAGNLYGTTEYDGANRSGIVFELSPNADGSWSEAILYSFCSNTTDNRCQDGEWPVAGLVLDKAGNLYGTTTLGGAGPCDYGCGTVFELSPPSPGGGTWTETVLYSFCAGLNTECQDGADPSSQLIFDNTGNLYGTTASGGMNESHQNGGTVFELSPGINGWTLTTLYSFCANQVGKNICPDGNQPLAGVTFDQAGNLYGTTKIGGATNSTGAGTVYELSPGVGGWMEAVLIAFHLTGNLQNPVGSVSFDPTGNLYSTASDGGNGGVFDLRAKTRTLGDFKFNYDDGSGPESGVLVDPKTEAIYGTTIGGGTGGGGTVFKITAQGQEIVLYNFCQESDCMDGLSPHASLIKDRAGNLYGTTQQGGATGIGVVFEISP